MLVKFFKTLAQQHEAERNARLYREIVTREAEIGGKLFGPIKHGSRREFFCLDKHTWIWHEEWTDDKGESHFVTTRYDIRPDGIYKAQDGQPYQRLTTKEARNLYNAMELYNKEVDAQLYGIAA